ncbi:MAG TPA: hypothetical protein VLM76_04710 [Patescibacteria group bacterium]|nr:hypothetical protein [Patescibacteria group bacterium]
MSDRLVPQHASLDERRQRRWELERADAAARILVERLEMADRPADVAIVRELRMRLSVDHRAMASPEEPAKP